MKNSRSSVKPATKKRNTTKAPAQQKLTESDVKKILADAYQLSERRLAEFQTASKVNPQELKLLFS